MKKILLFVSLMFSLHAMALHPVESMLERIQPGASERFVIIEDKNFDHGFEISAADGKPVIRGDNAVNIAAGLNWYLKYYAGIHLSWNSMTALLPDSLPLPQSPELHTGAPDRRYYLNYCTHSYSMSFWDWERWQKEIDWMALHGINMPLAITGTDVVWRNTLQRLGYAPSEIDAFVAGPAFQAWWLMNNLEGWGGPNTKEWYDSRVVLQNKILDRMREFGMSPVLPGYSGMVPHDADSRLGVEVSGKGIWNGFTRPAFLKTTDPMFDRIADIYYEELTSLFGKADYYSMDPFHEGGSLEGVDLAECGRIITRAMKRANPESVWVIQGWNENPRAELLEGVGKGDIVVLDLAAEIKPNWGDPDSPSPYKRPDGFAPHDWMYCMVLNFGGNVGLHGRMDCVIDGWYKARDSKYGKDLDGYGITAEGIENNPMMYELVSELIWRQEKIDRRKWLSDYTVARYGSEDPDIMKAWDILGETIYNCPSGNLQQGTTESVFCARPSMDVWQVSSWSRMKPYYRPEDVIEAAVCFLNAADRFADNENYRYDLVDIMRQALAEKGRLTYHGMVDAIARHDSSAFATEAERFLALLDAQNSLLGTRSEFMVGKWLNDARALAHDSNEADRLEENARLLVTTWGRRTASEDGGLRDYAHREWAGLLKDFYRPRWEMWIDSQRTLLSSHAVAADDADASVKPIDWYDLDEKWVNARDRYPSTPSGDEIETARKVAIYLK